MIPAGDVDERSIVEVAPDDLTGYVQCHFFAGIAGWSLAARLAGWPDDRELWTGSCPCQPFSAAGKGAGAEDERHLWPHLFRLLRARRPAVWMGEQVAAAVGKHWLDGVRTDLESIGYAVGSVVVPACAVDAPHRRDRLWIVAERESRVGAVGHSERPRLEGLSRHDDDQAGRSIEDRPTSAAGCGGSLEHANVVGAGTQREQRSGELGGTGGDSEGGARSGHPSDAHLLGTQVPPSGHLATVEVPCGQLDPHGPWGGSWIIGHDGKARRVEPGIRLLADGVPARVGRLRAYGNAIVPQVAAQVMGAYLDVRP